MMTRDISKRMLGEIVREFRVQRGLSQEDLAEESTLHRTYVGGIERGERNPSFGSLDQLVCGLGVTWAEFGRALDRHSARKRCT